MTGVAHVARAEIAFIEATRDVGISYVGPSWGLAWGDLNGDGYPDLWTGNHYLPGTLYLNQSGISFRDVTSEILPPILPKGSEDTHGAAWGDFNNDGFQDLVELDDNGQGNKVPNHLYENLDGQKMRDVGIERGIAYPNMRGRTPLWFDFDRDGRLDLLFTTQFRVSDSSGAFFSPTLLRQTNSSFEIANDLAGLGSGGIPTHFSSISDFTGDGIAELLLRGVDPINISLFDIKNLPFLQTDSSFSGLDAAIGDFNGDLRPDLFVVKGAAPTIARISDREVRAALPYSGRKELGLDIETSGDLTVHVSRGFVLAPRGISVYVGAEATEVDPSKPILLRASDTRNWGLAAHLPGIDKGIYIGLEPDTNTWRLRSSNVPVTLELALISTITLVKADAIGFNDSASPPIEQLWINTGDGFKNMSASSGLNLSSWGWNVVAGDFDNDMDLDIYVVGTSEVANRPNTLWENIGAGNFVRVSGAGGAEGSSLGKGDAVATADYNQDGFLDLAITNGKAAAPFDRGPLQIYRNIGNSNHWLQVDLEGVVSNRDAVGAKVFVTAGGITQVREQNGGMHSRTQNHQRLHFGLGPNTKVSRLVVMWPNGLRQTLGSIPANQTVRIIEGSQPSPYGKPNYQAGVDDGVFLWRESLDGPYRLRVSGNGTASTFTVQLLVDAPINAVQSYRLDNQDTLQWSSNWLIFTSHVHDSEKGFDFVLPANAKALLAVKQNGKSNPRQLRVGASGQPLTPSGWVVDADSLPLPPAFIGGKDLGLFMGRDQVSGVVVTRWSGDGKRHKTSLSLLSSTPFVNTTPVGLEKHDVISTSTNFIGIDGWVSDGWDGINVTMESGTMLGIAYKQDDLFQPQRANSLMRQFGQPNAYWLPHSAP
jgi:hypothetical protein